MLHQTPLFYLCPIPCARVAFDGSFLAVNAAFCELTGYSEVELLGRTWMSITHPDDVEADKEMARNTAETSRPKYSMIKRYLTKVQTVVWVNLHVFSLTSSGSTSGSEEFLVWSVPLPNHGRFKAVVTKTDGGRPDEVHVRPVVHLWDLIWDNRAFTIPALVGTGALIFKVTRLFLALLERNGLQW